jgi:hypothetical protein
LLNAQVPRLVYNVKQLWQFGMCRSQ